MKYIFKATTEYRLVVEADNDADAFDQATMTQFDEWEVTARPEAEWVETRNE